MKKFRIRKDNSKETFTEVIVPTTIEKEEKVVKRKTEVQKEIFVKTVEEEARSKKVRKFLGEKERKKWNPRAVIEPEDITDQEIFDAPEVKFNISEYGASFPFFNSPKLEKNKDLSNPEKRKRELPYESRAVSRKHQREKQLLKELETWSVDWAKIDFSPSSKQIGQISSVSLSGIEKDEKVLFAFPEVSFKEAIKIGKKHTKKAPQPQTAKTEVPQQQVAEEKVPEKKEEILPDPQPTAPVEVKEEVKETPEVVTAPEPQVEEVLAAKEEDKVEEELKVESKPEKPVKKARKSTKKTTKKAKSSTTKKKKKKTASSKKKTTSTRATRSSSKSSTKKSKTLEQSPIPEVLALPEATETKTEEPVLALEPAPETTTTSLESQETPPQPEPIALTTQEEKPEEVLETVSELPKEEPKLEAETPVESAPEVQESEEIRTELIEASQEEEIQIPENLTPEIPQGTDVSLITESEEEIIQLTPDAINESEHIDESKEVEAQTTEKPEEELVQKEKEEIVLETPAEEVPIPAIELTQESKEEEPQPQSEPTLEIQEQEVPEEVSETLQEKTEDIPEQQPEITPELIEDSQEDEIKTPDNLTPEILQASDISLFSDSEEAIIQLTPDAISESEHIDELKTAKVPVTEKSEEISTQETPVGLEPSQEEEEKIEEVPAVLLEAPQPEAIPEEPVLLLEPTVETTPTSLESQEDYQDEPVALIPEIVQETPILALPQEELPELILEPVVVLSQEVVKEEKEEPQAVLEETVPEAPEIKQEEPVLSLESATESIEQPEETPVVALEESKEEPQPQPEPTLEIQESKEEQVETPTISKSREECPAIPQGFDILCILESQEEIITLTRKIISAAKKEAKAAINEKPKKVSKWKASKSKSSDKKETPKVAVEAKPQPVPEVQKPEEEINLEEKKEEIQVAPEEVTQPVETPVIEKTEKELTQEVSPEVPTSKETPVQTLEQVSEETKEDKGEEEEPPIKTESSSEEQQTEEESQEVEIPLISQPRDLSSLPELSLAKRDEEIPKGMKLPPQLLSSTVSYLSPKAKVKKMKNKLHEKYYFDEITKMQTRIRKRKSKLHAKVGIFNEFSEVTFYKKKISAPCYVFKVTPTPRVEWAVKNRKTRKHKVKWGILTKFPWTNFDFSPAEFSSKKFKILKPTFTDQETSVLFKRPTIPPYWKTIKPKSEYVATSLYKEFNDNFGELDLLKYDQESADTVLLLKERYFENHLSNEELSLRANQEIASDLNRLMKLLNEQPFLVFPLGASPAVYSILPELDGINRELTRHKIAPDKTKKTSEKDVHIRTMEGIPKNILSSTENALSFSSDDCYETEKQELDKLIKFRDFDVEEYSKTCYSELGRSMLSSCALIEKNQENKKLLKKIPLWNFSNSLFLIDNRALNPEGKLSHFEKKVLKDEYRKNSFSHSFMHWEREYQRSRPLNSSIRKKKKS